MARCFWVGYSFLLNDSAARVSMTTETAITMARSRATGNSGPRGRRGVSQEHVLEGVDAVGEGLRCVSCRSAGGMDDTGYMAPERKNMGITRKFMMMLNPSKDVSRAAMSIPMEVMQNETSTARRRPR